MLRLLAAAALAVGSRGVARQIVTASLGGHLGVAGPSAGWVKVSAFFWNVHWECSVGAAAKAHKDCKEMVGRRFVELAAETGADIVFSAMLEDSLAVPSKLKDFGLAEGWTQADGPCYHSDGGREYGDATALAFGPAWHVNASGGGCLRHDRDARAFAVALVVPPTPIQSCPLLCVVGVHMPHNQSTQGSRIVRDVCGALAGTCSIAMGDWNVPAAQVGERWAGLIGGAAPSEVVPDVRTCCWPEEQHFGSIDHIATNVEGARHLGQAVHGYQHTHLSPWVQHKAVSAHVELPTEAGTEVY